MSSGLKAYQYVTDDEINDMMETLTGRDPDAIEAFFDSYRQMEPVKQRALGYMYCVMKAAALGYSSAYRDAAMMFYLGRGRFDEFKPPLRFMGWAGRRNNIGPAYRILPEALFEEGKAEIFYTDSDIEKNREAVSELAVDIVSQSSGIASARVETMENVLFEQVETEPVWGVVLTLDQSAVKESIYVNGKLMGPEETGGYVFVLPKAGEFSCRLGQLTGKGHYITLAKDLYCMK